MNTKELECFLQICQERSINKAAKSLYISTQGLSRIVKKIESELGTKVLTRTTSGVNLTDEGQILEKHAKKIMSQISYLNREIEQQHTLKTNQLKIAASYGLIGFFSPSCIIEFRKQHPEIHVDFMEYTDTRTADAIWYKEADIGLTYLPIDEERYDILPLNENELFFIVNKNNILSRKQSISFNDLRKQTFVLQNKEFKLHQLVVEKCKEAGFTPAIIFETNGVCMCNNLCTDNIAVSVTMKHTVRNIKTDNVVLIPFEDKSMKIQIAAISKKEGTVTYEMQLFLDYIKTWNQHS